MASKLCRRVTLCECRRLQGGDSSTASSHSRCHANCTKRGNCNLETGQCDCPFGLAGRWCEQLLVPACRLVNLTLQAAEAQGHGLLLTCAQGSHRNCECYRWVLAASLSAVQCRRSLA